MIQDAVFIPLFAVVCDRNDGGGNDADSDPENGAKRSETR